MTRRLRAFTLIEVLVALAIVALGAAALTSALRTAADTSFTLRERLFAEWIAENRLTEWRTARTPPTVGASDGELEWGDRRWRWRQEVLATPVEGLLRIDIEVRAASPADAPVLAVVTGFRGSLAEDRSRGDGSWDSASRPE